MVLSSDDDNLTWAAEGGLRASLIGHSARSRMDAVRQLQLGGHLPSNGPPGWQVIGRGMERPTTLVDGWLAAIRWMEKTRKNKGGMRGIQKM
jgi:hypothetical protein